MHENPIDFDFAFGLFRTGYREKAWKISCEEGLASSCKTVQRMNENHAKFKTEWNSDLANQMLKIQNLDHLHCKADKNLKARCLDKARKMIANRDASQASALLSGMCDAKVAEACFELGGVEVRAERFASSVRPYLNACSLGHTQACSALNGVQAEFK